MTALRREAIQLVEQMPEEQVVSIIQYIRTLKGREGNSGKEVTSKMKAFLELEEMITPVSQELDYDRELAEARNERYGHIHILKLIDVN